MTASKMIFNKGLINEDNYTEIKPFDELIRELQDLTLNEDWGYWHFSLLNVDKKDNLETSILNALSKIEKYIEPYNIDNISGTKTYNSILDLKNLTLKPIENLKIEIVLKAEHWSLYQGPTTERIQVSEKFHTLKFIVADKIFEFLQSKTIIDCKLIQGIDTFYSFGGDHCGDDILVDTKSGIYVIHFGFSS